MYRTLVHPKKDAELSKKVQTLHSQKLIILDEQGRATRYTPVTPKPERSDVR